MRFGKITNWSVIPVGAFTSFHRASPISIDTSKIKWAGKLVPLVANNFGDKNKHHISGTNSERNF